MLNQSQGAVPADQQKSRDQPTPGVITSKVDAGTPTDHPLSVISFPPHQEVFVAISRQLCEQYEQEFGPEWKFNGPGLTRMNADATQLLAALSTHELLLAVKAEKASTSRMQSPLQCMVDGAAQILLTDSVASTFREAAHELRSWEIANAVARTNCKLLFGLRKFMEVPEARFPSRAWFGERLLKALIYGSLHAQLSFRGREKILGKLTQMAEGAPFDGMMTDLQESLIEKMQERSGSKLKGSGKVA